ncbi:MAG TPA: NifU family protein [Cytophagales bacterium]|nr:NifU family protein [Cytophagales bacterium]
MQTKKFVDIYLESNPNPNSMKFVFNFMLLPEGMHLDFPDQESAEGSPLAYELFEIPYVKRVFFMSNFVTITKDEEKEWTEISAELKSFLKEYFEEGKPLMIEDVMDNDVHDDDPEVVKKIKSVLNEYIRPAVEQDGGAIRFHSYVDGVVKVLLQGSCSGCPSSTITLKAGIENLLRRMVPEVTSVEAEGI